MGAESSRWAEMRRDEDGLVLPSVDIDALEAELRAAGFAFEDDPEGEEAEAEVTLLAASV